MMKTRFFSSVAAALIFGIAAFTAQAAAAKQISLDARIFEAYKKIDVRTTAHEVNSVKIREHIAKISERIEKLSSNYHELEDATEGDVSRERMEIRGKLTELTAEYLNNAHKLVDAAAEVISANLSDLAALAEEVRKSGDPRGSVEQLKIRIRDNVAAGKSMRRALVELRNWAYQDPGITGRFESLMKIARTLDGRVTIDKARVSGRSKSSPIRAQRDRLASLDRTVDRLSDMYTQVMAEKESLIDLRDEVAMSVQLGRLEMIREVGERAIPNLIAPKDPSLDIPSLEVVANGITRLNDDLIREAAGAPSPSKPGKPAENVELSIDGLKNF